MSESKIVIFCRISALFSTATIRNGTQFTGAFRYFGAISVTRTRFKKATSDVLQMQPPSFSSHSNISPLYLGQDYLMARKTVDDIVTLLSANHFLAVPAAWEHGTEPWCLIGARFPSNFRKILTENTLNLSGRIFHVSNKKSQKMYQNMWCLNIN